MSRLLLVGAAALLATPILAAAPIPPEAGKGVAFPYPAKAPIVVCLNGYDKARDKLNKFLTAAVPKDAPEIRKLMDAALGKIFEGRKLTAVRKDARIFLVVNDLTALVEESPAVSVLVPVTKYKDFEETFLTKDELKTIDRGQEGIAAIKTEAFGEERAAFLVDMKDYVAITLHKATADAYAAKYTAGTTDTMGPQLGETFIKGDIAAYVNMDAINEQFGDQIRAIKGLIDFIMMQAHQQGAFGQMSKKQMETIKTMFKSFIQAVEDCRAVVATGEVQPGGLRVNLQLRFAEKSTTARFLATEKPSMLEDLEKLPAGLGMYQASRMSESLRSSLRDLGQEFLTTEKDDRGASLIEEHLKDLAAAGAGAEFTATAGTAGAIAITEYKQPDKAAKALTKLYKAIAAGGRVGGVVVKTAPHVSDEAEKYRGFTFSQVRVTHDFDATAAELPEQMKEAMIENLKQMTPEKATHWIGSNGKVVVKLSAENFNKAKSMLDKYLDGKEHLGSVAGFKKVREQLPKEANLIVVSEVESAISGMVMGLKGAASAIPGFPRLGILKKVDHPGNAYIGLGISLKGEIATVTGYVPTTSIDVARRMLESLLKPLD